MSNEKFTQGEWVLNPIANFAKYNNLWFCTIEGNNRELIQKIYGKTKEQAEANAKLIASAPKMYNALLSAMRIVDLWTLGGTVAEEHKDEAIALNSMKILFEEVIDKASNSL